MHSAQRSLARVEADVALNDARIQSVRLKLLYTESAREVSAQIRLAVQSNDEGTLECGFGEKHNLNCVNQQR
jgi:hypothetical protein